MEVAVVGHVEWIRFCRVERVPGPGEIAHSTEDWEQAGGGGGVAAIQLAQLAGQAALYTVLGDDELGRRSREELGDLTEGLPPTEKAAVVLRYGYDLTYDEIAAALGSSPEAARQAASSGVRRLRARRDA